MTESAKEWLRVSHSSMNLFNFCSRKFEFTKVYGQDKSRFNDESIPASVGIAFHMAYEEYMRTHDADAGLFTLLRHYPWALAAQAQRNTRDWDVAMSSFLQVVETSKVLESSLMYFKNAEGVEVPCTEVPFELRFTNTAMGPFGGIAFIGYIDLILRNTLNQQIVAADIKTHQDNTSAREAEYIHNTQQVPYGIVVEHLLGKKVESFDVAYLDVKLSLLEPQLVEFVYTKTQSHVQEWLTARVLDFRRMKSMFELGLFSRRDNGCTSFHRPCKYLDICSVRNPEAIKLWFDDVEDAPTDWKPWVVAEIPLEEGIV